MNQAQESSIRSLLGPSEELLHAQNVFCLEWYPNPHKHGVDLYPIVRHVWLALTNYQLRTGYFDQRERVLSKTDRVKWNFQVPMYLTKPVELGAFVMESFGASFADISVVAAEDLTLPSMIANDYQNYCWHQVPWQFGESIGVTKINDIRIYSLVLSYQGSESVYFSREQSLTPIADELVRRCA